jgi:hypothetical protein
MVPHVMPLKSPKMADFICHWKYLYALMSINIDLASDKIRSDTWLVNLKAAAIIYICKYRPGNLYF